MKALNILITQMYLTGLAATAEAVQLLPGLLSLVSGEPIPQPLGVLAANC